MQKCSELIAFSFAVIFINCVDLSESIAEDGVFESSNFWNIENKPVMANGHIGFVPYSDSVYMNGFYTGYRGESHRARIPNYANIQFEPCTQQASETDVICSYALDIFNGVFRTQVQLEEGIFTVEQIQYAHRYYETAVVNHIRLKRNKREHGSNNGECTKFWESLSLSSCELVNEGQFTARRRKKKSGVKGKISISPKYT